MQDQPSTIVVLGTGGTIAGTAAAADDNVGYSAAQLSADQLIAAIPAAASLSLQCEQVVQLDSKDMGFDAWRALALRVTHHLQRDDVMGIVITHGTDTLEETAYFLHRVLNPNKPVVMTAAMRPATSLQADGPQNLWDALCVARCADARGVVAVLNGQVHAARDLHKTHTYRLNAFNSGDAGVLGVVEDNHVRMFRPWPAQDSIIQLSEMPHDTATWPRVEIITSHAGADGALVDAACAMGVQGLVIAATGNGTMHRDLEVALVQAQAQGVRVLRSSRCGDGRVIAASDDALPSADDLTPTKARIELMLQLMALNPTI
jgi:L-asparaginase